MGNGGMGGWGWGWWEVGGGGGGVGVGLNVLLPTFLLVLTETEIIHHITESTNTMTAMGCLGRLMAMENR